MSQTIRVSLPGYNALTETDIDNYALYADSDNILKAVMQPLELLGMKKDFDFEIRTSGGGKSAQGDAIRLGIARALVKKEAKLREQLKEAGFLSRDPRIKERKKPGLKKARRAPQFSKR